MGGRVSPAAATSSAYVPSEPLTSTRSPVSSRVPAPSSPGVKGGVAPVASGAWRWFRSKWLIPAASSRTSTFPSAAVGSGTSSYFRTSGPPPSWITIACMALLARDSSIVATLKRFALDPDKSRMAPANRLQALLDVSHKLSSTLELSEVLRAFTDQATELTGATAAEISFWDHERDELIMLVEYLEGSERDHRGGRADLPARRLPGDEAGSRDAGADPDPRLERER